MIRIARISNEGGFVLVEAFIASVIMAIALFAVGTVMYAQFISLNENREKTIATLAAQGEIEFLRGEPFTDIVTKQFYKEDAPGLEYLHYGSGDGRGDVIVSGAGFTNDPNIKNVSVTVRWDSISGKSSQKTIATLMTNGGINRQ